MNLLVFFLYAFYSAMLMMWWGYGGYEKIASGVFIFLPIQIGIYFFIEVVSIYILLFWTGQFIRKRARNGFFFPWAAVLLITVPQLSKDAQGVSLVIFMAACVWFLHIPGEYAACWLQKRFLNESRT